jgi:pimeloyl-ACP methyl ester carboxylesterase
VLLLAVSKKKSREIEEQKRKGRNRVLTVVIALATLVVALFVAYLLFFNGGGDGKVWHLDSSGLLSFNARPAVTASVASVESTDNWTLEKISYPSFGDNVYALLRIPKNVSNPPVVIVLPAASVNKEADHIMAEPLCSWGYATLTLDERGNNGETPGPSAMDIDSGNAALANGATPVQYKQVYDVLLGYDYLRSRSDLDGSNIAVLGESMGTRFAIVAAALEPGIKGVVEISAGPYGYSARWSNTFIKSIEPSNYLDRLPPRKVAFFHFYGDLILPISHGKALYDAALSPKSWHPYNGNIHGLYSDVYAADLHDELKGVFGR